MARLDGKRTSPLPWAIGVGVIAILGAGGYFLLANRGADTIAIQNGGVKIVDARPGGLLGKSPSTTGNAMDSSNSSKTSAQDEASATTTSTNGASSAAPQTSAAPPTNAGIGMTADQKAQPGTAQSPEMAQPNGQPADPNSAQIQPAQGVASGTETGTQTQAAPVPATPSN